MTLGSGIFLSAIILGAIFLYIATKDRWRWKRIVLWLGILLILLPGLFFAVIFGIDRYSEYKENQPKVYDEFWDIKLGSTPDDVIFLKGQPTQKTENGSWVYQLDSSLYNTEYMISFRNGMVDRVGATSSDNDISLENIHFGDSYNAVLKRLGSPNKISKSSDGERRLLSYLNYHIAVGFSKGQVEYLAIIRGDKSIDLPAENND